MDDQADGLETIREYVWSGFYDTGEVIIVVQELIDGLDPRWLKNEVRREMARKQAAEATWPATTDCDQLDRAFEELQKQGIVTLQNAGYTKSDGLEEVTEAYEDAGGKDSDIVGYCFFHGQDLERVQETGDLWLAFGDMAGNDKAGVQIGHRVQEALEQAGFTVAWNGSIRERILIQGFRWQKRSE